MREASTEMGTNDDERAAKASKRKPRTPAHKVTAALSRKGRTPEQKASRKLKQSSLLFWSKLSCSKRSMFDLLLHTVVRMGPVGDSDSTATSHLSCSVGSESSSEVLTFCCNLKNLISQF